VTVDDRFEKYHESARLPALACHFTHKEHEAMSHENLSRRAILAGAASVPALALPVTVAVAAPPAPIVNTAAAIEPDPIIAAIAEHRRLDDV
jgi:hypothetical protein